MLGSEGCDCRLETMKSLPNSMSAVSLIQRIIVTSSSSRLQCAQCSYLCSWSFESSVTYLRHRDSPRLPAFDQQMHLMDQKLQRTVSSNCGRGNLCRHVKDPSTRSLFCSEDYNLCPSSARILDVEFLSRKPQRIQCIRRQHIRNQLGRD